MDKSTLISAFGGKILGIRNYKSDKQKFTVEDFLDLDNIGKILGEVFTGESDITPAGKVFLENYYGFEELAGKICNYGEFGHPEYGSYEKVLAWLEELAPMETITFIEEARGNIKPGAKLRSDLLPPNTF